MAGEELEVTTGDGEQKPEDFVASKTGYEKKRSPGEESVITEIPEDVRKEVDDFNAEQDKKIQEEREEINTKREELKKDKELDKEVQEQIDREKREREQENAKWNFRNP